MEHMFLYMWWRGNAGADTLVLWQLRQRVQWHIITDSNMHSWFVLKMKGK